MNKDDVIYERTKEGDALVEILDAICVNLASARANLLEGIYHYRAKNIMLDLLLEIDKQVDELVLESDNFKEN